MKLIKTIDEMREFRKAARKNGKRLGLVPTMGALHKGHISLVHAARDKSDIVVVSIFVNPTQFGPNEDFAKYPRNLENDCALLELDHVDAVFVPSVDDMYPAGAVTWVTVEGMSDRLCGKSRPGHFRGVTTVVAKLFHIIEPDVAFFGQKDAAQVAIIRRMVRDLNMPVEIEVGAIVREPTACSQFPQCLPQPRRAQVRANSASLAPARANIVRGRGTRHPQNWLRPAKREFSQRAASPPGLFRNR